MGSPFRDEFEALQSALAGLKDENSQLRIALAQQQDALDALRALLPENAAAFTRRLQEENAELQARVSELAPLAEELARYRRERQRANRAPDFVGALERLFGSLLGK
ncbi:MAG TPA: hypothetical protein VGG39_15095 [Polyangiaceae bacterium]|jgi:ABC-type transporter Mla subunit MlaD